MVVPVPGIKLRNSGAIPSPTVTMATQSLGQSSLARASLGVGPMDGEWMENKWKKMDRQWTNND